MSSLHPTQVERGRERAPGLDVVDRVSEMCFGLYMALTFVGAVSSATSGPDAPQTMLRAALGCNLAWGLVDAVMYLVRTLAGRGMLQQLASTVKKDNPAAGIAAIRDALPPAMNPHIADEDLEPLRARLVSGASVPDRPSLNFPDLLAAIRIFCIVVLSTFPVALPLKSITKVRALDMTRAVGTSWSRTNGSATGINPWRAGLGMMALGVAVTAAVIALGG